MDTSAEKNAGVQSNAEVLTVDREYGRPAGRPYMRNALVANALVADDLVADDLVSATRALDNFHLWVRHRPCHDCCTV